MYICSESKCMRTKISADEVQYKKSYNDKHRAM